MRMTDIKVPLAAATLCVALLAVADPAAAETTDDEIGQEISEAIDAIGDYTVEQRDEALAEAEAVLNDLDARIERQDERFRREWNQMSEAAREQAAATLQDLRDKRTALAEWYGSMRHGAVDAWEDIKDGFAAAYEDFKAAWDEAENKRVSEG